MTPWLAHENGFVFSHGELDMIGGYEIGHTIKVMRRSRNQKEQEPLSE